MAARGSFWSTSSLVQIRTSCTHIKLTHSSRTHPTTKDGKYYMSNPIWKKEREQPVCNTGWIQYMMYITILSITYRKKGQQLALSVAYWLRCMHSLHCLSILHKIRILITFFLRERERVWGWKLLFTKSNRFLLLINEWLMLVNQIIVFFFFFNFFILSFFLTTKGGRGMRTQVLHMLDHWATSSCLSNHRLA